jgi:hypothetical protein
MVSLSTFDNNVMSDTPTSFLAKFSFQFALSGAYMSHFKIGSISHGDGIPFTIPKLGKVQKTRESLMQKRELGLQSCINISEMVGQEVI